MSPVPGRLKELVAVDNRISVISDHISKLTMLETLNLSSNALSTLPFVLGRLESLTTLDVSHNELVYLPQSVLRLTRLRTLNMSFNQMTEIPAGILSLTALTELYVSDNRLLTLPNEIGGLAQLSRFDVSTNKLTMLPPSVAKLKSLVFFDTHNNPFSLTGLRLNDTSAERIVKVIQSSALRALFYLSISLSISFLLVAVSLSLFLILFSCVSVGYTAPSVSGPVLVAHMRALMNDDTFADCKLIINDEHTLLCHKCILAARCPSRFWNEILFELNVGSEVRLYNISLPCVKAVICFLYTETLPPDASHAVLQEVCDLAQKFGMNRLAMVCEALMGGGSAVPAGSLVRDLFNMLRTRLHTDMRAVSETGAVQCHRALLASRSASLRDELLKQRGLPTCELVLQHPIEVVNALLEYVYTDNATVGRGVAEPLLELAAHYGMPRYALCGCLFLSLSANAFNRLLELCEVALCSSVDMTNVVNLYCLAHRTNAKQLSWVLSGAVCRVSSRQSVTN